MPEPEEYLSGLPDVVRNADRPIIIYQGGPTLPLDAPTSNALVMLAWLALLTLCLGAVLLGAWQVWNPGHDAHRFSPIYADGQPLGLENRITERKEINALADGLVDFRDLQNAVRAGRSSAVAVHPLISDRDGVDDVRRQWDAMCQDIRTRLYGRRLAQIDARLNEARRQRSFASDPAQRVQLDANVQALQRLRRDETERERTDSDPALRCVPAAAAPVCEGFDDNPWGNPELKRPEEFDEASRRP
jgi:hypothetical protein